MLPSAAAEAQEVAARKGFRIIGPRLRITAARSTHVLHYDMSPTFLVQARAAPVLTLLACFLHDPHHISSTGIDPVLTDSVQSCNIRDAH